MKCFRGINTPLGQHDNSLGKYCGLSTAFSVFILFTPSIVIYIKSALFNLVIYINVDA